jgi:sulfate transport system substrate-binding protein
VFVVRKDNPKKIYDWPDLERVKVITPNPKTSGNGKLSMIAMWGSVVTRGGTEQQAQDYIAKVYRNVPVLDQGARGATMTFAQKKIGDVHLTWENEAYLEVQEANGDLEIIHPPVSVLAEPYVAVVDSVTRRKGTSDTAYAYMDFLFSEEGQKIIAKHYYRPIDKDVAEKSPVKLPDIKLFSVKDLGANWNDINKRFFVEGAMFDQIYAGGQR